MATGKRTDPYGAYHYLVEIGGVIAAGFSEVSGISRETQVEDYQEGGLNEFVHRLPGPARFQNIVLKRGITDSGELFQWHQEVISGKIRRRNGSIILQDNAGEERWRWNFIEAYPAKWSGPSLQAGSSAVAIETLELAHHGFSKG
ncbi:MAG: phage tail protein [Calditrichia bacterium]